MAYTRDGPPGVLQLREAAKPVPKSCEVLIRIRATTVPQAAGGSHRGRHGHSAIVVPGQELAGDVEAVGRKVTQFKAGDPVIAWSGLRLGAYAEYSCLPERGTILRKPVAMTYEEAATLPTSGLDATYLLRRANIQLGEKTLFNGAGGSMGTYAVQIAKVLGAEVTAVDSAAKLDMLRSIGADHVVDYTVEDFLETAETYDVIFDVIGNRSLSDILARLLPKGRYVSAVPRLPQVLGWQWTAWSHGKRVIIWLPRTAGRQAKDFAFLERLVEEGSVGAVIDRSFPLERAAEAQRYVAQGRKKGHVILTVDTSTSLS
jgi:NADPH:quinone reductase-like Zn-dependent oxidoreductase